MRFPVKWWYVAALVLVPLVALAAARWARDAAADGLGAMAGRPGRRRSGSALLAVVVTPTGVAAAVAAAVSAWPSSC